MNFLEKSFVFVPIVAATVGIVIVIYKNLFLSFFLFNFTHEKIKRR